MKVKQIIDEDLNNYRLPAMFVSSPTCGGKCCIEANIPLSVCQNDTWREQPEIEYPNSQLCERYLSNPITKSIVIGGLEPFEEYDDMVEFIDMLRNEYHCDDMIVIYTGYYLTEIIPYVNQLNKFSNIILKVGRYVPGHQTHYDDMLGVNLASDNQYAIQIS